MQTIHPLPSTTTNSTDPQQMKTISARRRTNNRRSVLVLVAIFIFVVCVSVSVFVGTSNNNNNDNNNSSTMASTSNNNNNNNNGNNMESSTSSNNNNNIKYKTEWPELTGTNGTDAKQIIEDAQDPNDPYRITQVYIVPQDSMVTMDYVTNRVRIFVDDNGTVVGVPKIG